jgi:hypothetical protein
MGIFSHCVALFRGLTVEWLRTYLMICSFWDVMLCGLVARDKAHITMTLFSKLLLVLLSPVLLFLFALYLYYLFCPVHSSTHKTEAAGSSKIMVNCLPNYKHGYHTLCTWPQENPKLYAVCCLCNAYTICHLTFASPCIIIRFKWISQQDATVLQVYYSTFICGSTCFGHLPAHHQEHATALGASGSTIRRKQMERCWSWFGPQPDHDQKRSIRFLLMVEPEAPSAVACSWWWAGRRPKHVEPHMNVE